MDVETEIESIGSGVDRRDGDMKKDFDEMRADITAMRADITAMRADITAMRQGLDSQARRTVPLFETLRNDIQMLGRHVADLASRRPRR